MKNGWLIIAAVVLFLWWRSRSATPATPAGGSITVGASANMWDRPGGLSNKPVDSLTEALRQLNPETDAAFMREHPAKLAEMAGIDAGSLGSNIPWGFWDPYLGAPGGRNPATGTQYDPFKAFGGPQDDGTGGGSNGGMTFGGGGGTPGGISQFPEIGRMSRPVPMSNM